MGAPESVENDHPAIRVVTWNIRFGPEIERAADEMKSTSKLANVDVLLVQELSEEATADLAGHLGMQYRYAAAAKHPLTNRPFGNAILSAWPMGEGTQVDLPHTARFRGQPRSATRALVTVGSTRILAYSAHVETVLLSLSKRVAQFITVAGDPITIDPSTVDMAVVGGDFNTPSKRSVRMLDEEMGNFGLSRVSPRESLTFRRGGWHFSLDHLFATGATEFASGIIASTEASDHRPVWTTLTPSAVGRTEQAESASPVASTEETSARR